MSTLPGIYVHMPFCPYLCPYCDFAKEPWRASRQTRYLAALHEQIALTPAEPAATIFFGGGTPNMTEPELLCDVVRRLRTRFSLPEGAEISVECNPDAPGRDLEAYARAGVTRLSIGVQSFVPEELQALGRRHTPADVTAFVAAARAAGIGNLSLDLMFATPGQTLESLDRSLDAALRLEPEHLSAYGLTIEEETPFAERYARDPGAFVDIDLEAQMYARLIDRLTAAGYEQYEISNFAKPGYRCAHNANYWNNGRYVGLGVGAASFDGQRRTMTTKSLDAYCAALETGADIPHESEELTGPARAGEAAMLALRRREGLDIADFRARYQIEPLETYGDVIVRFRDLGLLETVDGSIRLTRAGRPLANDVCAAFLAPAAEAA